MERFEKVVCCSKLLEGLYTFGKEYELQSSKNDPIYNLLSDNGTVLEVSSSYFTDTIHTYDTKSVLLDERDHRLLEIEESLIM